MVFCPLVASSMKLLTLTKLPMILGVCIWSSWATVVGWLDMASIRPKGSSSCTGITLSCSCSFWRLVSVRKRRSISTRCSMARWTSGSRILLGRAWLEQSQSLDEAGGRSSPLLLCVCTWESIFLLLRRVERRTPEPEAFLSPGSSGETGIPSALRLRGITGEKRCDDCRCRIACMDDGRDGRVSAVLMQQVVRTVIYACGHVVNNRSSGGER